MAYLVKDTRGFSKYWQCIYSVTLPDGRRRKIKKSTKQTDRQKAWEVCLAMVNAEELIVYESPTEQQLRDVINNALARAEGRDKLRDPTIRQQLETWIENKKGSVSEATLVAYQQARDLLLGFLGPRSARPVRMLTKNDAIAFRDRLLTEGRTPGTVNKIVKKYLTGPFESARKEGLIDYNPFVAVDRLKSKTVAKDVFTPEQVARLAQVSETRTGRVRFWRATPRA